MKKNISIINEYGFSLLEITVVLIIISILLSAVIPVLSRTYLEKAANKTVLDISAIQEAGRKFYIDNNKWPAATSVYLTPIAALQANGYLPSAWNAINPFGASMATPVNYSYNVTSNASLLTVCTLVSSDAQAIIENSLTSPYIDSNGDVCSSVSVPGGGALGLGQPIPVLAGMIYYANTDGLLVGNTYELYSNNGFEVVTDSNPTPVYVAQKGAGIWYSGGPSVYMPIFCPIRKGNYYEVIGFGINGGVLNSVIQTLNFIPLNS